MEYLWLCLALGAYLVVCVALGEVCWFLHRFVNLNELISADLKTARYELKAIRQHAKEISYRGGGK